MAITSGTSERLSTLLNAYQRVSVNAVIQGKLALRVLLICGVKRSMPILPHASSIDRWLLQQVFKAIGPAPIRLVLNSGAGVNPPGVSPVATVRIRDRRTLAELALDPEIGFGEAYSEGRIHVDGDLVRALEATYDTMANAPSIRWHARLW